MNLSSTKKTDVKDKKAYIMEFKQGPDMKGPKRCLYCRKLFVKGDSWRKSWDLEHRYAVGVHSKCLVSNEKAAHKFQ